MPLSQEQVERRWAAGMSGAGAKYAEGVQAFQGNPCAMAADASGYWQQRVSGADAKTKYERALRNPAAETAWRENSVKIGASHLASGAQKGRPKYARALAIILPAAERSKAAAREARRNGVDWLERVRMNGEIMKNAVNRS